MNFILKGAKITPKSLLTTILKDVAIDRIASVMCCYESKIEDAGRPDDVCEESYKSYGHANCLICCDFKACKGKYIGKLDYPTKRDCILTECC